MLHSNGLFCSCTDKTCFFKWSFREQVYSQMSQLNDFFPSCTDKECLFKWVFRAKLELQITHLKDFFFEFSILKIQYLTPRGLFTYWFLFLKVLIGEGFDLGKIKHGHFQQNSKSRNLSFEKHHKIGEIITSFSFQIIF